MFGWSPSTSFKAMLGPSASASTYDYSDPMEHVPLNIQTGDIVTINLNHPLRYANDELRGLIRMEVDVITELGIAGRGSEVQGLIVPKKGKEYDRVGGDPSERPTFFPWSSVQNLSVLHRAAEYQAMWDAEQEWV